MSLSQGLVAVAAGERKQLKRQNGRAPFGVSGVSGLMLSRRRAPVGGAAGQLSSERRNSVGNLTAAAVQVSTLKRAEGKGWRYLLGEERTSRQHPGCLP